MANQELTPKVKEWLSIAPGKRSIEEGAELLLRINHNRILYANILRNPDKYASRLEYEMQKILKFREENVSREEVQLLVDRAEAIAVSHGIAQPESKPEFKAGKRADHDELPPDVRQLYTDNDEIRHRMRDIHTKLRLISESPAPCKDPDRKIFAEELIRLDRLYRDNWNLYDHYVKGTPLSATVMEVDRRTAAKNVEKSFNLAIGKYRKAPSDALAQRVTELYAQIPNPSAKITAKLKEAGLA